MPSIAYDGNGEVLESFFELIDDHYFNQKIIISSKTVFPVRVYLRFDNNFFKDSHDFGWTVTK